MTVAAEARKAPAARPPAIRRQQAAALHRRAVPADLPDRLHPRHDGVLPHAHDRRPDHRGARRAPAGRPARGAHRRGRLRPAPHRAVLRVPRPGLHRQLRHDAHRQPPGHRAARHATAPRPSSSRSTRSSSRSSSASRSACSPPTSATSGRMPCCASSRSSATRRPCSSPACCSSSSSRSGSAGCRSPAARRVRTELQLSRLDGGTGIYLIDAIRLGNPAIVRRRAAATPCCPASRSAC